MAVPITHVRMVFRREEEAYNAFLPQARDLAMHIEGLPAGSKPEVLVQFENGDCWGCRDAGLPPSETGLVYLSIPADLFRSSPPWCRGVLWGEGKRYFVTDPPSLGRWK